MFITIAYIMIGVAVIAVIILMLLGLVLWFQEEK